MSDEPMYTVTPPQRYPALKSMEVIPGFERSSIYIAEQQVCVSIGVNCVLTPILFPPELTTAYTLFTFFKMVESPNMIHYDSYYTIPGMGLVCADRSSQYDLYYYPLSQMLYAVDVYDKDYVCAVYVPLVLVQLEEERKKLTRRRQK